MFISGSPIRYGFTSHQRHLAGEYFGPAPGGTPDDAPRNKFSLTGRKIFPRDLRQRASARRFDVRISGVTTHCSPWEFTSCHWPVQRKRCFRPSLFAIIFFRGIPARREGVAIDQENNTRERKSWVRVRFHGYQKIVSARAPHH